MQLALIYSIKIALHLTVKCKHECIPVGYVPSAAVAVGEGGLLRGVGVCPGVGGQCVCPGWVSAQGVSAQRVFA